MRRFLAWALGVLILLAVVGIAGIGWYYSGEILLVEQPGAVQRDTKVLAVKRRTVTLEANPETTQQGTYGLDAPEAYGQIGEVRSEDAVRVTREYRPLDGTLKPGDLVAVDGYGYPQDPDAAFDFEVAQVDLPGPLGTQPTWFAEGRDDRRWAVLVHGRGARSHECFRLLEILREDHEVNVLCPSYRNDLGAPADPAGIYRQGAQEWRDIEPAVQYALDRGARDLVLGGFSMGGQITANFLRRSELAGEVDAVIWDSPLLDWGPAIAAGARDRGVPGWLVPIGMQASEWRAGVDYADLNQVDHADEFDVPILLLHASGDTSVPAATAEDFARARPDIVTFRRFAGDGHVRGWNEFPSRYRQTVNAFIRDQL